MSTITESKMANETDDAFELDVQVTTDVAVGYTVRRCNSSDTCGSACASS